MKKQLLKITILSMMLFSFSGVNAQATATISTDATHINATGDLLKSDGNGGYVAASTTFSGVTTTSPGANSPVVIKNGTSSVFFRNYKTVSGTIYAPTLVEANTPSAGNTKYTWGDTSINSNLPLSNGAVLPADGAILDWTFKVEATSAVKNLTFVNYILSVKQNTLEGVSFYPNPASDFVTINAPEGSAVQIYNSLGATVKSISEVNSSKTVSISDLAVGLYLVRVTNKGKIYQDKIVKK